MTLAFKKAEIFFPQFVKSCPFHCFNLYSKAYINNYTYKASFCQPKKEAFWGILQSGLPQMSDGKFRTVVWQVFRQYFGSTSAVFRRRFVPRFRRYNYGFFSTSFAGFAKRIYRKNAIKKNHPFKVLKLLLNLKECSIIKPVLYRIRTNRLFSMHNRLDCNKKLRAVCFCPV